MNILIIFHHVVSYSFCASQFQGEGEVGRRKEPADFGLPWKLLGITCLDSLSIWGKNNPEEKGSDPVCLEAAELALGQAHSMKGQWHQGEGHTKGGFYWVLWTLVQTWAEISNLPQHSSTLTTESQPLPRQAVSLA